MTISESTLSVLNGKVAVLTGASRGIGKAIADALVANGAKVVIGDILEKEGEAVAEAYNEKYGSKVAAFRRTDVTKYEDNVQLFRLAEKEFGGVDYALLNAGIASNANSMFTPLDDELDERIIDINTTAVIKGTKVALLHMAKRGGGSIVHLASLAGFYSAPDLSSYNASKHAVIGYTRSFTLMPHICNVRVNAICPYWVATDLIKVVQNTEHGGNPMHKLLDNSPKVKIETVVEGFLTLVTDETRNAQTLMAIPSGLEVMPPLEAIGLFKEEKHQALTMEHYTSIIPVEKNKLAIALEKYESDHGAL